MNTILSNSPYFKLSPYFSKISTVKLQYAENFNSFEELKVPKRDFGAENFFAHSNAIKNYNLSFLGKKTVNPSGFSNSKNEPDMQILNSKSSATKSSPKDKPVYIIDAYKNFRRFENAEAAAKKIGSTKHKVIKCANGDIDYVNGFISAFADSVEEIGRTGTPVPDTFLISLASEALAELGLKNQPSIGGPKAQTSAKQEAKKQIELSPEEMRQKLLKEELPVLDEIPKEDIEHLRQDQLFNGFYVMKEDGRYGKYFNKAHVAKHIGATTSSVLKCTNGTVKLLKGYAMAPASEVETTNKKGETVLKLNILKERFKKKDYFYAVDENGKTYTFETTEEAAKKTKANQTGIIRCLLGQQKTSGNFAFIKRNALEIKQTDGKIRLDKKVLSELKRSLTESAVYVIDPTTGEYDRYDDREGAAKALETSLANIGACIRGRIKTVNGKIVINANEIETRYREGIPSGIWLEKINQLIEASQKTERLDVSEEGFYAIKEGFCKKYFCIEEAGKALKTDPGSISICLKGKGYSAGGYTYAFPSEIEMKNENGEVLKDENGEILINQTVLNEKLSILSRGAVYAIRRGLCERYDSQTEAAKALKIPGENISDCIRGRRKSTSGTAFLPANTVEKRGADGRIIIDEKLLQDTLKELTKHEVYVFYPDGRFEKFPDRMSAAEKYGIPVEIVKNCVAGKRKPEYNGIIFIAAKDIEITHKNWKVTLDKEKLEKKLAPFMQKEDYPAQIVVNTLLAQLALIKRPDFIKKAES